MIKNRISEKKLFMILTIELFALTSLILPAILVGFSGKNGLPVLLMASAGLFLLAAWYLNCYEKKEKSPDLVVEEEMTGIFRWLVKALYEVRFFIHGLFLMIIFVNLIREVLLPDYNRFWLLVPFLLLVFMTAGKQLRVRGRMMEVLFPFIFLPLLVVLFLALFQLDYASLPDQLWAAAGNDSGNSLFYSVYGILLFYQPVEFLLFLLPAVKKEEKRGKDQKAAGRRSYVVGAACLFVIFINVIMYVASIGMFGTVRTGEKLWSALYIMQSVRLPGNFVERLDILFLVFWIFGTFALFSAYMYYGSRFVSVEDAEFLPEIENRNRMEEKGAGPKVQKKEAKKKGRIYTIIWLLCIFILTLIIRKPKTLFEFFIPYKMWVDFPLSILLPALLYGKKKSKMVKKGVTVALSVVLCGLLVTGCQERTDIEDKNYVMTLGIEKGEKKQFRIVYEIADLTQTNQDGSRKGKLISYEADSLNEAEEMDKMRDDKKLDYGHLKAILFSRQLMTSGTGRADIIGELEKKDSIAGTTLIFFTEEKVESIVETGGQKASSFGEYMDQMMSNQKSEIGKEDTLANFLRDESENTGSRSIFLIKSEEEQLVLQTDVLETNTVQSEKVVSGVGEAIVRFHIRANSDSEGDQNMKNSIKNRILPKLQNLLADAASKEDCLTRISASLNQINDWVQEACSEENYLCESRTYLCQESFPLKVYGDMVLPSGVYDALRIDLGKAEGANWWCMMYPSLCLSDGVVEKVSEDGKEVLKEELKEEYDGLLIHRGGRRYRVKWKIMEAVKALLGIEG